MKFQIILIGLVAFGVGFYAGYQIKNKSDGGLVKPSDKPLPMVTVIKIKEELVKLEEEYPGRVAANRVVEIRPQVGGIILKRLFEEGKDVIAGQPLYQIDAAPFEQNINKTKADVEKTSAAVKLLEQKFLRYSDLAKSDGISKQELDDVEAALTVARADKKSAEAALNQASINLEYTKIIAPVGGRIGKSIVNEGSLVAANQSTPLTTITQLDPINIDISQSSVDFQRLKESFSKNEKILVKAFPGGSDKAYGSDGQLQFSSVIVESGTGSLQLRSIFANPNLELLPGMFVKTRLLVGEQNGILVPQRATMRNPDGELMVWLIDENETIKPMIVKSSRTVGDKWLINKGLKPGDRIVLKGFQKAFPGMKVQAKEGF